MATLIPHSGEFTPLKRPKTLEDCWILIGESSGYGDGALKDGTIFMSVAKSTPSGEHFLFLVTRSPENPFSYPENLRAEALLQRKGIDAKVYSSMLYLSADEYVALVEGVLNPVGEIPLPSNGTTTLSIPYIPPIPQAPKDLTTATSVVVNPTFPAYIPVHGNTYPVKDKLRAIGGYWEPNKRMWFVPSDKKAEAEAIVGNAPKSAPTTHPNNGYAVKSKPVPGPAYELDGSPRLNKIAGKCLVCKRNLPAGSGHLVYVDTGTKSGAGWRVRCLETDLFGCQAPTVRKTDPKADAAKPDDAKAIVDLMDEPLREGFLSGKNTVVAPKEDIDEDW